MEENINIQTLPPMIKIYSVNNDSLFFEKYKKESLADAIYKSLSNNILRLIRRLHLKSGLPFYSLWYNTHFKKIESCVSTVIIFDSILTVKPSNYLKSKYPYIRVIFWHWNHIEEPSLYSALSSSIERWSYDIEDCRLYSLHYNTQFYFLSFVPKVLTRVDNKNCFFIGKNKGRVEQIVHIERMIIRANLNAKFKIVEKKFSDQIPYNTIVQKIIESQCIVDIVPNCQHGMTLRPLEALFFHKKLITNYQEIIQYDFYSPRNIFIVGRDDEFMLADFIASEYDESVSKYITEYDFSSWINRFLCLNTRNHQNYGELQSSEID